MTGAPRPRWWSGRPNSPTLRSSTGPTRSWPPRCADCHHARAFTWAPTASSTPWTLCSVTRGAWDNLFREARRGESDDPPGPLLAGQPPLDSRGPINLVEFNARRPFHPQRLHDCLDLLLEGVIRTRGRLWLASQPEQAMWLESAGGGLRVSSAGRGLGALTGSGAAREGAGRTRF